MELGEYHTAKAALDRAQRAVEILVNARIRKGPEYDEAVTDLREAHTALRALITQATTPQREMATLDISESTAGAGRVTPK